MQRTDRVKKECWQFTLWLPALLAVAVPALPATGQQLQVRSDTHRVTVAADQQPLLVYRFGDVPAKPYVQELYTPGGVNLLRDAPSDHLHHHGIMFAVSVDAVSFWTEGAANGRQQHLRFETQRAESRNGHSRVVLTESLDWLSPQSEAPVLSESRVLEVARAKDLPATVLTWQTRLEAPAGQPRALGGSHYYGLGIRFVEAMDRDGKMFNASGQEGDVVRGTERLVGAKWVAYTASVDGKPVTAALFDHPDNPRHPGRMFTMTAPFAYLAATMNLWKEPLGIEPGQTLRLRYGVAAADGQLTAEQVEQLYERWVRQGRSPAGSAPVH